MNPGRLNIKVLIERREIIQDEVQWLPVYTVWAWVKKSSAVFDMAQGGAAAIITHEIVIRKRDDISPGYRITAGNVVYEVEGQLFTDAGYMTLLCVEVDRYHEGCH